MVTRTSYRVDCPCGHIGAIRMAENDAPFSRPWESYTLTDLDGSTFDVEGAAGWDKVFAAMRPMCPKCGSPLTPGDLRNR